MKLVVFSICLLEQNLHLCIWRYEVANPGRILILTQLTLSNWVSFLFLPYNTCKRSGIRFRVSLSVSLQIISYVKKYKEQLNVTHKPHQQGICEGNVGTGGCTTAGEIWMRTGPAPSRALPAERLPAPGFGPACWMQADTLV